MTFLSEIREDLTKKGWDLISNLYEYISTMTISMYEIIFKQHLKESSSS